MYAYFFFQMCLVISVTKPRQVHTCFKDGFNSNSTNIEAQIVETSLKFDLIERETLVIKRLMPRRFIFFHKKRKVLPKIELQQDTWSLKLTLAKLYFGNTTLKNKHLHL